MATEQQCQLMIERLGFKIKRLQGEISDRIAKKKKWQETLRDLKWIRIHPIVFQGKVTKKAAKPYPDRIDRAIETMAEKILKKATKKVVKKKT